MKSKTTRCRTCRCTTSTKLSVTARDDTAGGHRASQREQNKLMEEITSLLPLLIPLILLQLILIIVAVRDLVRRERTRGLKWVWAVIILFVNLIGPIVYLAIGREE